MRRGNFDFVLAILLTVVILGLSGYLGYVAVTDEVNTPIGMTIQQKSLRDIQKANLSSPTPASIELPKNIAPQVMGLLSGLGVQLSDFGFLAYWNPDLPEIISKPGREVISVGISYGDYKGTMIFRSTKGIVVATPKTLYAPNVSWEDVFDDILGRIKEWQVADPIYKQIKSDEAFELTTENGYIAFSFEGNTYVLDRSGFHAFTSAIPPTIKSLMKPVEIPFGPNWLFGSILFLLALIAMVILVYKSSHDLAIASLAAFFAMVMMAGASIFAQDYLPTALIPISSFLASGIIWTIPMLTLSVSLGLDLLLGWFWLIFSLLSGTIVLASIFPKKIVWTSAFGVIGLILFVALLTSITRPRRPIKSNLFHHATREADEPSLFDNYHLKTAISKNNDATTKHIYSSDISPESIDALEDFPEDTIQGS